MSVFERFRGLKVSSHSGQEKVEESRETILTDILKRNVEEDKFRFQEDEENIDRFLELLLKNLDKYLYCVEPESPNRDGTPRQPIDATTRIYFTDDCMHAYICAFPPTEGGKDLTLDLILEDMRYEGITYGIQGPIIAEVTRKKEYLHIIPVAHGTYPQDGKNGEIREWVDRKENLNLDVTEGNEINFSERELIQAIHKGDTICEIIKPTKSVQGKDITGRTLYGREGDDIEIPMGKNTMLSENGKRLIACIDGAISIRDGKFCVKRKQIILGDVTISKGSLEYAGDLFIKGDVLSGVTIRATGNVIVEGRVLGANIISGGTIRIQQGMQGYGIGTLKSVRQIQCSVIEDTKAEASGDVYAEVIANSFINSKGSVYIQGGRGFLVGGDITALGSLKARRIGNQSGCLNRISLGCNAHWQTQIDQVEKELVETMGILKKVIKNVSTLKASNMLSQEKREILAQLTEQKELYNDKEKRLRKRLQVLKSTYYANNNSSIICDEIYPITEISIGDSRVIVENKETECNVHLNAGRIFLR